MSADARLRPVAREDGPAILAAQAASREHLAGWIDPLTDLDAFAAWFALADGRHKVSFVIETAAGLAGIVNLGGIIRGAYQGASIGYYGFAGRIGGGVMTRGVGLALAQAFGPLGLHRVEANIQPGNARSLALVARLGFRHEGYSPRYLRIAGAWRDHERWALLADDPQAAALTAL